MQYLAILGIVLSLTGQPLIAAQLPNPAQIHLQGCVERGIQPHCLVMKDLRTGRLYNLLFKDMQPAAGYGIEAVAEPASAPGACMQGTPVNVLSWAHKSTLRCSPGPSPRK